MNNRINDVLQLLADGRFHSGQALGEQLGVTRAAINQHIQKLIELGVEVFSVHGKGYRLGHRLELLDAETIAAAAAVNQQQLEVQSVVGSSNDEIRTLSHAKALPAGYAVFAEAQTAGRGRRGKPWFSPFGSNLYISIYWPLTDGINSAMGLSLVVGVAVADALTALGIKDVGVKWPNDVYVEHKKLAGILVELDSRSDGQSTSVIGIGVNLRMPEQGAKAIDQRWTDIAAHISADWSRNAIAGSIYRNVLDALERFSQYGLEPTRNKWVSYDIYLNQSVTLMMGQRTVSGICRGIDENGAILLDQQGSIIRYFGGEVSLRAAHVID